MKDIQSLEMPVITNLKFNPNKVYNANVNHLKELQMIKQREEAYKNYSYNQPYEQMYQMNQSDGYSYPMQGVQMYQNQAPMMYYQSPNYGMQNQYYSPQPNQMQYYMPQNPTFASSAKKTSKLSTKSPHAITGHKLSRRNTFAGPGPNDHNFSSYCAKSPPPNDQMGYNLNGEQSCSDYAKTSTNNGSNGSYFRKSTFDDTEAYYPQTSPSPFSSPEEYNMQMRIVSNFKLNPFPIENEGEDSNAFCQNTNSEDRMAKRHQQIAEEEDMFAAFEPFSNENDSLQMEDSLKGGPSPGPIFSLISQAEADGPQN